MKMATEGENVITDGTVSASQSTIDSQNKSYTLEGTFFILYYFLIGFSNVNNLNVLIEIRKETFTQPKPKEPKKLLGEELVLFVPCFGFVVLLSIS